MSSATPAAAADDNLWSELLSTVRSRAASDLPDACVLVLGDANSGKTSLVSRLQSGEQPARAGHGLEFNYIEVTPETAAGAASAGVAAAQQGDLAPGEVSRLGVFVLGGDAAYAPLLKFVFGNDPKRINRSLAILCASMSEPWSVLTSLEQWARLLDDCVRVAASTDADALAEGRRRQELLWQTYVEPQAPQAEPDGAEPAPAPPPPRGRMASVDEHSLLPLGDHVLTCNIAMPLVVALTKCDAIPSLERECDLRDEHFDFIQMHVRRFCLKYGAALAYTSAKDKRNCESLRSYVLQRTVAADVVDATPACVVERDSVFIPAGWDNAKKIAILHEGLAAEMSPDDRYSLHIKRPPPRNLHRMVGADSATQSEEEQLFLSRLQPMFAAGANAQATTPQTAASLAKAPPPNMAAAVAGAGGQQPIAAGALPADAAGGSLVQEFFKNLLTTKGTGAPPGAKLPAAAGKVASPSDAELELLRLAKGPRAPVS